MKSSLLLILLVITSLFSWSQPSSTAPAESKGGTFTNPLLPTGPDPWVIVKDGYYYYMNTVGTNLTVWKTRSIGDLGQAEKKVVWSPPASGPLLARPLGAGTAFPGWQVVHLFRG